MISQEYAAAGGIEPLAQILNSADRSTERNVLDKLTELDIDLAEEVRSLLFVFEDIVKIDDRGVQQVMKEVDQKDLALALRGVSDEVKDKVLRNMSTRGAEMLVDELEHPAAAEALGRRRGPGPHRGDHPPPRGGRRTHHLTRHGERR